MAIIEDPVAGPLSVEHIDYLQRAHDLTGNPPTGGTWTMAPPAYRRLAQVRGVGRFRKDQRRERQAQWREQDLRPPTQDLLAGLCGYKVPVAFLISRRALGGVSLAVGTWADGSLEVSSAALDARQRLVEAVVDASFASTDVAPFVPDEAELHEFPFVGLATGFPNVTPPDPFEGAGIDRLIAAMGDTKWAVLILAQPVHDGETLRRRRAVLDEIRIVQAEEKAQLSPSPLAQHYSELLTALLRALTLGYSIGMWRTAAYLFGDRSSYHRLVTLWTAAFAGEKSLPEPLRVRDAGQWSNEWRQRLNGWGMPDTTPPSGPGRYRHAFTYQTLLNSQQLASYICFPENETPGFAINDVPMFDTDVRSPEVRPSVPLGCVVSRDTPTHAIYPIGQDSLAKHTFVAGITGSGKTNTIIRMLQQAAALGTNFLVIEPAKAEYRQLLNDPHVGADLQIFTFGNELVSPCRLNPFEFPD